MKVNRQELMESFYEYGSDILETKEYQLLDEFVQHGGISCRQHCVGVAFFSLAFVRHWGITCDERALVRGALLHDYFLYDWHDKACWHAWHGFSHAATALHNAERDFQLTEKEKEIIRKHMWPLNLSPPMTREAWVVTIVDKYCSGLETMGQIPVFGFLQEIILEAA